MENDDVRPRAASTPLGRRAFLSASAVTAVAAPLITGAALAGSALASTGDDAIGPVLDPGLRDLLRQVDPARIEATILRLVQFGTRHTASSHTDPVRGIGAATHWGFDQQQAIPPTPSGPMTVHKQTVVPP